MKILLTTKTLLSDKDFVKDISADSSKTFIISSNPDISIFQKILYDIRLNCQDEDKLHVFCIGGGSVIDSSKVLTDLINRNEEISLAYLNNKKNIINKNIKLKIFPTTFGTGAEITSFATLWDFDNAIKYSVADLGYINKDVTYIEEMYSTMPKVQIVANALDAGSHAIESRLGKNNNPDAFNFSELALQYFLGLDELAQPFELNQETIRKFIYLGMNSGKAINLNRTSICHAISYPLTLNFNIPHGIAAFLTIPSVMRFLEKKHGYRIMEINILDSLLDKALAVAKDSLKPIEILDYDLVIDKIFANERSNNFNFEIARKELKEILNKSFSSYNDRLKF